LVLSFYKLVYSRKSERHASTRAVPLLKGRMFPMTPAEAPALSGCTVLLASAATAVTITLRGSLQRLGYQVSTASKFADYEDELRRGAPPMAVLSEAAIRDADWRSLLRAAQRARDTVPFVLASQSHDPLLWAELLNLGGFELLPAPWDEAAIARVLNSAVRRAMRAREVTRARELNGSNVWRFGAA
jgi:DNA-binding NtrC family response regulator